MCACDVCMWCVCVMCVCSHLRQKGQKQEECAETQEVSFRHMSLIRRKKYVSMNTEAEPLSETQRETAGTWTSAQYTH